MGTSASFNVAVGSLTAQKLQGNENTILGAGAAPELVGGDLNIILGDNIMPACSSGTNNVVIGNQTLPNFQYGNNNIVIGAGSGDVMTYGYNNIFIGDAGGGTNDSESSFNSGLTRIGITNVATEIGGIYGATTLFDPQPVYVGQNNLLGTITSSIRFKKEVKPMGEASDALFKLSPVTFMYNDTVDKAHVGKLQYGLIAEEVEKIAPGLVTHDKNGQLNGVRYDFINEMLLNEFLKEHQRAAKLEEKVDAQEKEIGELKGMVEKIALREEQKAGAKQVAEAGGR